ncbi:hypothetical protein [Dankookia sp. P2]|uniref:hypothetical protein n=1 Tax=Dankookia sp. P2 TaxID=3423955 RepID=UPI003D66F221
MGGWFRREVKTLDDLKGLDPASPAWPGWWWSGSAWCRRRSPRATFTRAWSAA